MNKVRIKRTQSAHFFPLSQRNKSYRKTILTVRRHCFDAFWRVFDSDCVRTFFAHIFPYCGPISFRFDKSGKGLLFFGWLLPSRFSSVQYWRNGRQYGLSTSCTWWLPIGLWWGKRWGFSCFCFLIWKMAVTFLPSQVIPFSFQVWVGGCERTISRFIGICTVLL